MAITRKDIKNLIGGVSQQPDQNRLPNQCSEQINFLSDPIDGLTRRPGTEFIKELFTTGQYHAWNDVNDGKKLFTHVINRSPSEQLLLCIAADSTPRMTLWNLQTGAEIAIHSDSSGTDLSNNTHAYLTPNSTASDVLHPYSAVTIADHTFIVNKDKLVQPTSAVSGALGNYDNAAGGKRRGMIFVKQGSYNNTYTVTVRDSNTSRATTRTVTVKASKGTASNEYGDVKTDRVAKLIYQGLTQANETGASTDIAIDISAAGVEAWAGSTGDQVAKAFFSDSHYTSDQDWNSDDGSSDIPEIVFERHGSVITWYCAHGNEASYNASTVSVDVTDSYGDTLIAAYTEEKESFDGLPLTCVNNFTMKIVGAPESALDDYYVKFVCDDPQAGVNEGGPGKWVECPKEGVKTTLDASKMPHQLIKVSSSVYKFVEASWDARTAGDDTSNPLPSFCVEAAGQVGAGKINDIFYYKGRLGILSGEHVIMSELDNPYNFWRTTATQVIATDRIDVSSSVNEVTELHYAVPFSNQLVVFSDRTQFLLTHGAGGFAPQTASLALISRYESSRTARPRSSGNGILFAQERRESSAIYEMYPTGSTEFSFEAQDITENLKDYIQGKVINIRTSTLAKTALIQTDEDDNNLYCYRFYDKGRERVQSAWSKFQYACDHIRSAHIVDSTLYTVQSFDHDSGNTSTANGLHVLLKGNLDNTITRTVALDGYIPSGFSGFTKGTYGADISGHTQITLPWNQQKLLSSGENLLADLVVVNASTGQSYDWVRVDNNKVKIAVNLDAVNVNVGLKYTSSYQFSDQYVQMREDQGQYRAMTTGRTTVKWCEVYLTDNDYIRADVTFPAAALRTNYFKEYTGVSIYGGSITDRDTERNALRFAVAARNDQSTITLSTSSHHLATITGATFELLYTSRSRRVN